jgi:hypothetical protein
MRKEVNLWAFLMARPWLPKPLAGPAKGGAFAD